MRGGGPRAPGGGVSSGAGPCEGGALEVGGWGVVVQRRGMGPGMMRGPEGEAKGVGREGRGRVERGWVRWGLAGKGQEGDGRVGVAVRRFIGGGRERARDV